MDFPIEFCTSADGVRIAYTAIGEGRALVAVPPWSGNFELDWQHSDGRGYIEDLSHGRRLVLFDRRGCGSSQRGVDDLSLDAHVSDVASLADHLALDRFDLWGDKDGAAVAVAYATRYPERVSRLVLWAPFAYAADLGLPEAHRSLAELARGNWGVFRRALADLAYPTGPTEMRRWFSDYLRRSVSSEIAARYIELQASLDVRSLLPQVRQPTLVLQRQGARLIPESAARAAAGLIPDVRFVPLEGDAGPSYRDPRGGSYAEVLNQFLAEGRAAEPSAGVEALPAGGLQTILFTDLESSTALTQRLGDEGAQELLRGHNDAVRSALEAHDGREVKHTGDGIMASFPSAVGAVQAGLAIQRSLMDAEIRVRVGINAGEPIAEDDDLFGMAVIKASRICDRAEPGQVLVSNVVRELCEGKTFQFSSVGDATLKGFDEPVALYEVRA